MEDNILKQVTGSYKCFSSLHEPAVFCDRKRENLYVAISEKTDIIVLMKVVHRITYRKADEIRCAFH